MSKDTKTAPHDDRTSGYGLCLVSKMITVDGYHVGYMYREEAEDEADSGWRFMSGQESEAYIENARNFDLVDVNVIANRDPAIIDLLDSPPGAEFDRLEADDDFIDSSN